MNKIAQMLACPVKRLVIRPGPGWKHLNGAVELPYEWLEEVEE